jgi:CheY-like chemotaxis protein
MNPPEVSVESEVEDVDIVLEYMDEILEMAGEVVREFTEEEVEVLEALGRVLEQWEEFEFVEYE